MFVKDYPNTNLVVECCHFTPSEFLSVFPNAKVIALGITDETIAMTQINKRDWMSKLNETVKKEYVSQIVAYSLELKNFRENTGIWILRKQTNLMMLDFN